MSKEITREVAERVLARMKTVDPEAYLREPNEYPFETAPRIYLPKFGRTLPLGPDLTNELVAVAIDALRAEGILPPSQADAGLRSFLGVLAKEMELHLDRRVTRGNGPSDRALIERWKGLIDAFPGEEPKGTEEGE
jgi:hypothetical protein